MAPAAQRAARARLLKAAPEGFPKPVLRHALAARWDPELPSRADELYWRAHPCAPTASPGRSPAAAARRRAGAGARTRASDAAGALSRGALRQGTGTLLHLRQPVFRFGWHRDLAAPAAEPRAVARAVCRGLEVLERAERSGPPLEAPAGTPLRDDRAAAPARRRGRPPHPAFPGFAPAPRPALARPPRLLGHAEPAGHQPSCPCREMRRGGGRPGPLADAPAALPLGQRRGLKTRWPADPRIKSGYGHDTR